MSENNEILGHKKAMLAWSVVAALGAWSMPVPAWADGLKEVGGHVGLATPLVTVSKETKTISDQFTLLTPIGVTVKPGGKFVVDFEVVVANPISPVGTTGLVIDPGVVYNWGAFATGLRLAFQTNANANVGLIPLINVGLADFSGGAWFVEAAFPTFLQSVLDEPTPGDPAPTGHHAQGTFNVVLHTGIGF